MRFSFSKTVVGLSLVVFIFLSCALLSNIQRKKFTQTCNHSDKFHAGLHALAYRAHNVLSSMGLTHFLCYGSLWGQLRLSKSLPWESDIELCLLNEEIITKDEVYMSRIFKNKNMNLDYDSSEGVYSITDPSIVGARVELIVFEKDPMVMKGIPLSHPHVTEEIYLPKFLQINMLRRIGWKRRVLPPDCESLPSLNCFPPRLVSSPLPQKEFGGYVMPVPKEGIEIQKYHYPNNWWKEILPKNC